MKASKAIPATAAVNYLISRTDLVSVARSEMTAWEQGRDPMPRGLAMAVIFAFIHRLTTGETVEQTFFQKSEPTWSYEI